MSQDASSNTAGQSAIPQHIILIDDDQDVLDTYSDIFVSSGYTVSTFTSGVDALKLIMKSDVDVIFCDLMMPTMAGDMFYKAVQRVKPHLCSRFVFITGFEGHPQFQEFIKREKPVVLYKPVTSGKLLGTLKVVLRKASPAGGAPGVQKGGGSEATIGTWHS